MDRNGAIDHFAELFWGRKPSEAERNAMQGQMERVSLGIAPPIQRESGALFGVEPAAFEALMRKEALR
ncbi:hypothetical protein [Rhizobium sp. FKL33]|uniref:hypothetical protein n=1 Tax=Rhizobium sp. FKL33 TaxID=2562307 RepID=UPI0010C11DC3|nr:hypothetical protein [Rhizobium sp. FKL33]